MRLRHDERGAAVQVGAAILLGFLVVAMTTYQVQVVPSQNAEIEFDHNQGVQDDMAELRNAMANADDRAQTTSVGLGTRYPARTFFVNPPPAQGSLTTTGPSAIRIQNATSPQVNDSEFFAPHDTVGIAYEPGYTEFDDPPTTVIEHGLLYNAFDSGHLDAEGSQSLVSSDGTISIPVVNGSLRENGVDRTSVTTERISGPSDVDVEEDGGPITFEIPTEHPNLWIEELENASVEGATDTVSASDTGDGSVRVELPPGGEYTFEMMHVHVGTPGNDVHDDGGLFDVGNDESTSGGTEGPSSMTSVEWDDGPRTFASGSESIDLSFSTDPDTAGGAAEFSVEDSSVGTLDRYAMDFNGGGGTVSFDPISPGTTTLTVESGGQHDEISVEVTGEGTVSGTITDDANGQPIEGAEIEIAEAGLTTTTDASGDFVLENVPSGEWDIVASAPGFESTTDHLVVEEDQTTEWDVGLVEVEGPYFDVESLDAPDQVQAGDQLNVDATIANAGTASGTQNVSFEVADADVATSDEQSVALDPGEQQTLSFTWDTEPGDVGEYTVTVGTDDTEHQQDVAVTDEPVQDPVQTVYPTDYNDGSGGNTDIPPGEQALGMIDTFANLQEADQATAIVETEWQGDHTIDIGTQTTGIDPATTYQFELSYFFQQEGDYEIDLVIADANNDVLQRESMDTTIVGGWEGDLEEQSFELNQAATDYVSDSGNLYVRYERVDGGSSYIELQIDYQRISSGP